VLAGDAHPVLPHLIDPTGQIGEVVRVSRHHHEVGQLAGLDGAEPLVDPEQPGGLLRGRTQHLGRRHAGPSHQPELAEVVAVADRIAGDGLRALGYGMRVWDRLPDDPDGAQAETGLTLLGLVGLMDPPRQEAKDAVALCRKAGIVAVMITGDHPLTAVEIARQTRAKYLELRGNPYSERLPTAALNGTGANVKQKDLYFTFIAPIEPSDDANFAKVPRKQRRMIRQSQKNGLKAVFDNSRLREFYEVYAESVRNLGTPVFGYGYFQRLAAEFGDHCIVQLVEFDRKVIAGVLSFLFKDQVLPYYGGALKEHFHRAPNDFMYWELMSYAAARGVRIFDFGRSKEGTGPFNFKRHWGFEPRPLPYWYLPVNGAAIPDTSPLNPKLQWAIRIWRNLPLKVTMALGPHIVRHIP